MGWAGMGWFELVLGWSGLGLAGLSWAGQCWAGLCFAGLGWLGWGGRKPHGGVFGPLEALSVCLAVGAAARGVLLASS